VRCKEFAELITEYLEDALPQRIKARLSVLVYPPCLNLAAFGATVHLVDQTAQRWIDSRGFLGIPRVY